MWVKGHNLDLDLRMTLDVTSAAVASPMCVTCFFFFAIFEKVSHFFSSWTYFFHTQWYI